MEYFNSHPHKEDDCTQLVTSESHWEFQLTSSQGGWHGITWHLTSQRYFNSHPHKEDDDLCIIFIAFPGYFNSHPHKEDDSARPVLRCDPRHFNSHPHKEDDHACDYIQCCFNISTHILTRRMTAILNKNNLFKITYYINNKHFISIVDIFFHFHIYF